MRKKIIAGNWKMNLDFDEANVLLDQLIELKDSFNQESEIIICPSPPYIGTFSQKLKEADWLKLGGQNCFYEDEGAFTGETSPVQLKSMGVEYCIIGHSERRENFNEDYIDLSKKAKALLNHGLTPVFCCGEALETRESNVYREFVINQVEASLFELSAEEMTKVIIAYEPIWAIGTGETASAEQAQEIHSLIRTRLKSQYGDKVANVVPIIYGGSVKPENAGELFSQADIDGGLIGGASLNAEGFVEISNAF